MCYVCWTSYAPPLALHTICTQDVYPWDMACIYTTDPPSIIRVVQDVIEADALVLGAPGRQGGMCGEMRMFLDTLADLQHAKELKASVLGPDSCQ